MGETNEDKAKELLEKLAVGAWPSDNRAEAAIGYAILALADEVRNLAAEVEKAGWAAKG
jgi:hypothetical protein